MVISLQTQDKITTILLLIFKAFLRLLGLLTTNMQKDHIKIRGTRICHGKALESQYINLNKYRFIYN